MKSSQDRILTTHVGSLPRAQAVVDQLFAQDRGDASFDLSQFDVTMAQSVYEIVGQQKAAGVDIPSDGEMSKISYATYIRHRLNGFEISSTPPPRATPQDLDDHPAFRDALAAKGGTPKYHRPVCTGPISIKDFSALHKDIANLKGALQAHGYTEGFMNSASPGVIAVFQPNAYYPNDDAYLAALVDVMRVEYETIVNAGLILQIDCPDLAMGRHIKYRGLSDEDFLRRAEMQVEALNAACVNIPASQMRMHLCWGNYEGPHTRDIALRKVFRLVMQAKPQAILIEACNPRHAHEWIVWHELRDELPDDKIVVPGVVDTTTNFVEHPELVAERIERYANVLGRERVMAGSDCGFGTFAGFGSVHPSITFEKIAAMAEGARIVSGRLWV
jgi:5-methyltetrahydropteroyltriglutamate--homocysteine methyltransferase